MVKLQDKLRFRDDFPPVSTEAWEEKIHQDLKGADYNKKLIWRTIEGFQVRPYYRAEDLKNIKHLTVYPAEYPWVRSKSDRNNNWFIRQDIAVRQEPEGANKMALDALNRGVDSIGFVFGSEDEPDEGQLHELLKDICIQANELNFQSGHGSGNILDLLIRKIEKESIDKNEVRGSVNYNPLGCLNRKGNFC